MRFVPEFDSGVAALHYATAQGLDWIGRTAPDQALPGRACASPSSHTSE